MECFQRGSEILVARALARTPDAASLGGWLRSLAKPLRRAALAGLFALTIVSCSGPSVETSRGGELQITPNLELAHEDGFQRLAGLPPFRVAFGIENVRDSPGRNDVPSYSWDLDGDSEEDSDERSPEHTYETPGEYVATLTVEHPDGSREYDEQRIVVIGEPDWPDWRFGVTSHLNRAHNSYSSDEEVERAASLISTLGVDVVRLDMSWPTIQPESAQQYDWRDYDYLMDLSERSGFDILPVLGYSSSWSSSARVFTPESESVYFPPAANEYAWFNYQAAKRYGDRVKAWQVWNEPNNEHFMLPEPDPVVYGEMLRESYLAIKYADPDSVIVMGGLSNDTPHSVSPSVFLKNIYDEGGGDYFDAASRHPYTTTAEVSSTLRNHLTEMRSIMSKNGDAEKPIWVTEFGATATPGDAFEYREQAELLSSSLDVMDAMDGVPIAFWYNFRDTGADPVIREYHYGLINWDFTPKPSYEAYRDYISQNSEER